MKKLFALSILFLLFAFASKTEAAVRTYTYKDSIPGTITVNSATSATFHFVFPVVKGISYAPAACLTTDSSISCDAQSSSIVFNANKTIGTAPITWDYTNTTLDPTKQYFLILLGSGGYKTPIRHNFYTGNESTVEVAASSSKDDDGDFIISSKIDPIKYPFYRELSATLVYSRNANLSSPVGGPLTGRQGPDLDSAEGINTVSAPGTFFWHIPGAPLSPSTLYYYQVTITAKDGRQSKSGINKFNTADGATVASDAESQQTYDEQHGYTFLFDTTKKTFLPDPDLCAQRTAANGGVKPDLCDMNDILNFGIKILIGISAVFLVFRLMYEGYIYMTSDVPFLKASSKSGFLTALGGLLLAMSSYIILNTINPKLVSNTVGVNQLSITVDDQETADQAVTGLPTGALPTGKLDKCPEGVTSFNTAGGTFVACKSIAAKFTSMMAAAHAAGYNIRGGGFRTSESQIRLRTQNCGATYVYTVGAKCNPPTAIPGKSNHESGLAFDLTCDGALIRAQDNKCFVWLKNNAGQYGLKNFAKEPWHWSTDGR